MRRWMPALLLSLALSPAWAQDAGGWALDPGVLVAGNDLLQRAPDREIDALFQAVHAASRDERQGQALCALFVPGAERSIEALNTAAMALDPASRERFAGAVAAVLLAALQSPPQPWDPALARQGLKAAGATAAILHDGFLAGLNADGDDADSRGSRCRSLRWLLDAMDSRPAPERAAMTRLLLAQGMTYLGADAGNAPRAAP
ncbi:hypothetical protein MQC88_10340 [Luteimonas sp. 50]|uniref:Uncharacterized protein n=1 Tax=Cognatiluteimonas sedimenti TaxID=2927791 RepID=A0ABT0A5Z2_9GAMM|nr:hypothetical protein [Lysobacter sedimenti]MCJ0826343.1 hypothetical protein [Lysobacter sedimenti]